MTRLLCDLGSTMSRKSRSARDGSHERTAARRLDSRILFCPHTRLRLLLVGAIVLVPWIASMPGASSGRDVRPGHDGSPHVAQHGRRWTSRDGLRVLPPRRLAAKARGQERHARHRRRWESDRDEPVLPLIRIEAMLAWFVDNANIVYVILGLIVLGLAVSW